MTTCKVGEMAAFVQIAGQEQLVAIYVVVNSYSCEEVAWLYRLDTPQTRALLEQCGFALK